MNKYSFCHWHDAHYHKQDTFDLYMPDLHTQLLCLQVLPYIL